MILHFISAVSHSARRSERDKTIRLLFWDDGRLLFSMNDHLLDAHAQQRNDGNFRSVNIHKKSTVQKTCNFIQEWMQQHATERICQKWENDIRSFVFEHQSTFLPSIFIRSTSIHQKKSRIRSTFVTQHTLNLKRGQRSISADYLSRVPRHRHHGLPLTFEWVKSMFFSQSWQWWQINPSIRGNGIRRAILHKLSFFYMKALPRCHRSSAAESDSICFHARREQAIAVQIKKEQRDTLNHIFLALERRQQSFRDDIQISSGID